MRLVYNDGSTSMKLYPGHPSSRIYKRLNQPDIRVVATGTILDGYILALSSFGSSMNYRSAVLHGFTSPIGNSEEDKNTAFAQITERIIPGRWDHARKPTPAEFKGTAVIRVLVDSARHICSVASRLISRTDLPLVPRSVMVPLWRIRRWRDTYRISPRTASSDL